RKASEDRARLGIVINGIRPYAQLLKSTVLVSVVGFHTLISRLYFLASHHSITPILHYSTPASFTSSSLKFSNALTRSTMKRAATQAKDGDLRFIDDRCEISAADPALV